MTTTDTEIDFDLSRRRLLAAAGVAAMAVSLIRADNAAAATPARQTSDPMTTPPVAGMHLQFGADASSEMVVSWHTLQPVQNPRVILGQLDGRLEQTVIAKPASYTDAKSGVMVYAYHAKLDRLRADSAYLYAALHDGAEPDFGTFRTSPRGRAPITFTSFGDQGTPTLGRLYQPPNGVTISNPPYVNDNLGSPAAADTTLGVERLQPLFHLFNGDLCYANVAQDRIRNLVGFLGEQQPQRPQAPLDALARQPRERVRQRTDRLSGPIRPTSRCLKLPARPTSPMGFGMPSPRPRCA